jgi:hypothetical protein
VLLSPALTAADLPRAAGPTKLVGHTLRGLSASGWLRLSTKLVDCAVGLQTGGEAMPDASRRPRLLQRCTARLARWIRPHIFRGLLVQQPGLHGARFDRCRATRTIAPHPTPPLAAQHVHRQPADTAKMLQQRLQDVHGIIVELDESLGSAVPLLASHLPSSSPDASDSAGSTPTAAHSERQQRAEAVEACRHWLKEAQSYVLHTQRQLDVLAGLYAADSPQWLEFVAYSADEVGKVAQEIRAGGELVSSRPPRPALPCPALPCPAEPCPALPWPAEAPVPPVLGAPRRPGQPVVAWRTGMRTDECALPALAPTGQPRQQPQQQPRQLAAAHGGARLAAALQVPLGQQGGHVGAAGCAGLGGRGCPSLGTPGARYRGALRGRRAKTAGLCQRQRQPWRVVPPAGRPDACLRRLCGTRFEQEASNQGSKGYWVALRLQRQGQRLQLPCLRWGSWPQAPCSSALGNGRGWAHW